MMKKLFVTLLIMMLATVSFAQNADDPVVLEINGKNITKSQFKKEFLHSIGKDPVAAPTACTYEKRKALEDYVQLFIDYRVKLEDAYEKGFDTLKSLNEELATYRKELAAPYLIDSSTLESLLREAYDRNHYVLHAAHILVPCSASALPEDTLKAYNHAMELYRQALANDDFYAIAQKEMHDQCIDSRDPLVREKAEKVNPYEGDLGCFSVFDMIYPFESAAYGMNVGEVHAPVRTRFGYHIIKLFARHNYYGKVQIAHIWISNTDPSAAGKIKSAYRQLESGTSFEVVAKNYSEDRTTSRSGGVMPELAHNQMPFEYVATIANGLKVGEYSEPFQSRFGWHIIKLIKQESIPSYESMVPYYRSRMTRSERSDKPQHIFAEQCKEKYDFVDYTTTKVSKKKKAPYAADLSSVRAVISDSIFSAIFNYDSNQITDMRPLFKIGDRQFNSRQLARYMYKNKKVRPLSDLDIFLRERYEEFIEAKVLEYADDRLELDNPEFGALIDEYRHGLMIFAYNDYMVWSRAIKDTAGFAAFYDSASVTHYYNDTNDNLYYWDERARVHIYSIPDSAMLAPAKAMKLVNKGLKKNWDSQKMVEALSAKLKNTDTTIADELVLVEKDNQNLLSANEWAEGVYCHPKESSGYDVLVVERLLYPTLKSQEEARGYYLNDYQNYLERQNNASLRAKYKVKVYQEAIDSITY